MYHHLGIFVLKCLLKTIRRQLDVCFSSVKEREKHRKLSYSSVGHMTVPISQQRVEGIFFALLFCLSNFFGLL